MNEERMKILQMIEKGTVSAEEGAKLLSAVEEGPDKGSAAQEEKKKYGLKHFLGDAVEKIKNSDFDLSFGEYVEFDHETELEPADFHDADFSIANGSLEVHTWEKNYVKATSHVKVYQVENEEEARQRFHDDVQFEINNDLLRLASPSKKIKTNVELFLPKKSYTFVKSKLTNGPLHMDGLKSEHFQLKTSNGPVELSNVSGETCKLETGNGAITLTNGVFEQCYADTINGAITLGGAYSKSDASAVSGSITVNHTGNRAHTGFYKTTTGSVKVSLPTEKKIDGVLRTKMGSLYCKLDNYKILNDKKEVMNKLLEFEAYEQFEDAYHIEAETKTGSVTVNPPVQL
ncbi:DUF4097 family beta strand repeat-containing protein [Halobacillus litoralis]|uniref:Uncharacterized protein n=1 Tax=Halobacillus litoralis TaxID=45668 RepID=A0A410MG82_9BACI|nr:DUF4097 family beta strand repeat-containing protein [Halobacillus litoralis]QAS53731.1 hypothetical protein HLI_16730 [Halobacillus litoralis]